MLRRYIDQTISKEFKIYDADEEPVNRRVKGPYVDEENRVRKGKGNAANFDKFYSELAPYYDLEDEYDDTLIFESRFESGNLGEAYRVGEYEYNLYNTREHYPPIVHLFLPRRYLT